MPVRYQLGIEIIATMVWGLVKVSVTISAAEADRPRYSIQHTLESIDIMMTAQAPVMMIWSRKLAKSTAEAG